MNLRRNSTKVTYIKTIANSGRNGPHRERYHNNIILLEGNLPKPRNPYRGQTNDQPLAEELKYSRDRARWRQHPTSNLLEVWQNSAIFGSRLIGGAIEALLTRVLNQRSSVLPIVVVFVASAPLRRC